MSGESAQRWIDEQLAQQRQLLLMVDRLAEPDPLQQLFGAELMRDYLNLYQGTEFADMADIGPWLVRLHAPRAELVRALLETPQRNWGWLASVDGFELAALSQHWRERMLIHDGEQRSLFRFQDNRVLARSLAYLPAHQHPQLLGPLHSVLCWDGQAWQQYDNPRPGPSVHSQPAPWIYPEPAAVQQATRLANLEQWLWQNQPEKTAALASECNLRDWLAQSLAKADDWGWYRAEQLAFLLGARRGAALADPAWQPLPEETCSEHFNRCHGLFGQRPHSEKAS